MTLKFHWMNLITAILTSLAISFILLSMGIGTDHPMLLQYIVGFTISWFFPLELIEVVEEKK